MEAFRHYLTLPFLLEGMALTLRIFVAAMAGGLVLGLVVALMRLSSYRVLSGAAWLYVWLFRGTPVLLQLVFLFDALPLVGIVMPPVTTAILGFALNEAAFRTGYSPYSPQAVGWTFRSTSETSRIS